DGTFASPVLAPSAIQSTPLVASLDGDSAPDAVVLSQSGQIVVRRGQPELPGTFASPQIVNPAPEDSARDIAIVSSASSSQTLIPALDAQPDSSGMTVVTVYQMTPDGSFQVIDEVEVASGILPAQIASEDLNGDGLGDLVISAAGSNQIYVSLQVAP